MTVPTPRLEVWIGQHHAGDLIHDPELSLFRLESNAAWLQSPDGFALNAAVADRNALPEAHSAAVRHFFENMLPEGHALDDVCALHQTSKSNLFGLLAVLGGEMQGAIRVLAPGQHREPVQEPLREIGLAELSERIRARPHAPFSVWDRKVRLSIAGFQDKLAVFRKADRLFLAEGDPFASTHILKPEAVAPTLRGITSNEFFCMRLARRLKLDVAEVELLKVPEPVLSVRRFDRAVRDAAAGVDRIHVIDGCQALGIPPAWKYECPYSVGAYDPNVPRIRNGASLPQLFHLLDEGPHPLQQKRDLLRWVIFQALSGNADAHAKNLSFFSSAAGLRLAPAYDLVCTQAFSADSIEDSLAMAVGDAFTWNELGAYEWAHFAITCGLAPKSVAAELRRMTKAIRREIDSVAQEVVTEGASAEHVERVCSTILAITDVQENQADLIHQVNLSQFEPPAAPGRPRG